MDNLARRLNKKALEATARLEEQAKADRAAKEAEAAKKLAAIADPIVARFKTIAEKQADLGFFQADVMTVTDDEYPRNNKLCGVAALVYQQLAALGFEIKMARESETKRVCGEYETFEYCIMRAFW